MKNDQRIESDVVKPLNKEKMLLWSILAALPIVFLLIYVIHNVLGF